MSESNGKKPSLEEMLEEFLNPRPRTVEAAEDVISGGATVMPFRDDFEVESASKGKLVKKNVKEALPLRASDLSMGSRYQGNKVSRKDLEEEGWELEEDSEQDENDDRDAYPAAKETASDDEVDEDLEGMQEEDGDEERSREDEDEDNEEDDISDEEVEIDEDGEIVIKPKQGSSPSKRKRELEDDESDGEVESDADDRHQLDEDEEDDVENMELLGDVEQEDQDRLEKELRKLKEEEKAAVTSIKSDNQKELEKAIHAKNQKLLWNNFMELRISLQQMLNLANRLPHPEAHTLFTTPPSRLGEKSGQRKNKKQKTDDQEEQADASEQQDEHSQKLKTCFDEASASLASLFDDLFSAKKVLLAGNDTFASVLDVAVKKVEERDDSNDGEDKDSDDASKLACAWEEFKSVEDEMWKKTDEVIDRWNRKTMLSQGIMQKELKVINRTVLNQISQLLSDRQRLVKRTQLKRTSAKTFGAALYAKKTTDEEQQANGTGEAANKRKEKKEEYDEEIFDDSDFYHQLLREVVESGTANVTDPIALGRSFAQLRQLLRKNKKKDVDQKASKGRKLRYEVMEPLVNYMPPITTVQQVTPMAAELFAHLFSA